MTSSRIILAALGLFLIVLVILATGRIYDSVRNRISGTSQETTNENEVEISTTPTINEPESSSGQTQFTGKEIPSTGPINIVYVLLAGGLVSGIILKRKS